MLMTNSIPFYVFAQRVLSQRDLSRKSQTLPSQFWGAYNPLTLLYFFPSKLLILQRCLVAQSVKLPASPATGLSKESIYPSPHALPPLMQAHRHSFSVPLFLFKINK